MSTKLLASGAISNYFLSFYEVVCEVVRSTNFILLYPLKISKNLWFSVVFRVYRNEGCLEMGSI